MGVPKSWSQQAHAEWSAGRKGPALKLLFELFDPKAPTPDLPLQAAYYLFLDGAFQPARDLLERVITDYPDNLPLLLNLAVLQERTRAFAQARQTLERYVALGGAEVAAFDGLATVSHQLGDDDAARKWGERAISRKYEQASTSTPHIEFGSPRPGGTDIISFSLWGENPRYLRGALHNLLESRQLYPTFTCRFYIDASVPRDLRSALESEGAEVSFEDGEPSTRHRLTRRFLVADDLAVRRFLVRDCDSLVNSREAAAVHQWLDSGKPFHVMRDWWTHTDPMLAGMWGGLGGVLPPLKPMIESYRSKQVETPNWDQWFLRDRVWPSIANVSFVHDRFFRPDGSAPFPGPEPEGNYHVGQNEFAVRKAEQAAALAAFRSDVPSLRL
ncbi:tetratricopeptide repeat protein [Sphingomonas edaphi]|uniref:tetratricopeptide repeat protein n=1 Tax=Sphingomonas edaphi TaxID=2315689 RepID=UPI0013147656|nr:tetratricopeptide repeat protein [Sphingomonas edaphi]